MNTGTECLKHNACEVANPKKMVTGVDLDLILKKNDESSRNAVAGHYRSSICVIDCWMLIHTYTYFRHNFWEAFKVGLAVPAVMIKCQQTAPWQWICFETTHNTCQSTWGWQREQPAHSWNDVILFSGHDNVSSGACWIWLRMTDKDCIFQNDFDSCKQARVWRLKTILFMAKKHKSISRKCTQVACYNRNWSCILGHRVPTNNLG